MLRLPALALMTFAITFSTNSASALDLGKPSQTKIIHGVFTDGATQIKFSIPEGRGLTLKHRDSNATYRLISEKVDRDGVAFIVVDEASAQVIDRLALKLDGKPRGSEAAGFSLALTGVSVERTTRPPQAQLQKLGGPVAPATCCVPCGGWIVCCTPSPGWCCELECVGGDTCEACTAEQ